MARIRQFKPGFFTDDKVGRLSRDARLFFFGVLSEADDEGRLVDAPKRLAGVIYPFDEDVTPKKIEKWITELEAQQMVLRYQHEGGRFLYVRKFKDHQKMSHPTPSTLPPPPSGPGHPSGDPPENFRSGAGVPPDDFAPVVEGVFEGLIEGVSVSEGVLSGSSSSSKLNPVGDEIGEEEDLDAVDQALFAIATAKLERCLNDPEHKPINDRAGWLTAVIAKDRMAFGVSMSTMVAGGATVDLLVRTFDRQPAAPSSPYPAAGEQLPPAHVDIEFDDEGHAYAVPRRVG